MNNRSSRVQKITTVVILILCWVIAASMDKHLTPILNAAEKEAAK